MTAEESGMCTSAGLPSLDWRKAASVLRSASICSGFLSGLSATTILVSGSAAHAGATRRAAAKPAARKLCIRIMMFLIHASSTDGDWTASRGLPIIIPSLSFNGVFAFRESREIGTLSETEASVSRLLPPATMSTFDRSALMDRRAFLRQSAFLGSLAALQPLHALGRQVAMGAPPPNVFGYGPLVDKGDLLLPVGFNYQIISSQGKLMSDGQPTPGLFDGMGAFPQSPSSSVASPGTILIRNHENRELGGEQKVVTGSSLEYDELAFGGNTKLVVERRKTSQRDPDSGRALFEYNVVEDFAILGGTSTNCAGGEMPFRKWITCEETVKRSVNGKKHGYIF